MPTDAPELQYWDACLFIVVLVGKEPDKVKVIKQLLADAKNGKIEIVVSNLVLAEIRPNKDYSQADQDMITELLETNKPYVHSYGLTRNIVNRSRDVAGIESKITVPDSIHIATAIEAGCSVMLTYDGDKKTGRRRSGDLLKHDRRFGAPPLRIETPKIWTGPLFEATRKE
jgi:predicted nucleic acid-binding protein